MLEKLKAEVCAANKLLPVYDLVTFTWGNVSATDPSSGLVVIKPSGVGYDELTPEMMCVVTREGVTVEGKLNPSSDTPTHVALYNAFPKIGGVVHTHSCYATAFAQAKLPIHPLGTTHADYFYGDIPCTRQLTTEEIETDYELNTGKVIAERFGGIDENAVPGVLVACHGVFTWGKNALEAVHNAKVVEQVAHMALITHQLNPDVIRVSNAILNKHYLRKHGENAYYGQK